MSARPLIEIVGKMKRAELGVSGFLLILGNKRKRDIYPWIPIM